MTTLSDRLTHTACASPVGFPLSQRRCLKLDLATPSVPDTADVAAFGRWIDAQIQAAGADFAAGGYGENRALYRGTALFEHQEEPRTLHLGIDLWLPAGTSVHAVLPGHIHSFSDNARIGDYGPTVILEHEIDGVRFHTLYGHLSRRTLAPLRVGQPLAAGERFGDLGEPHENLAWPPHLHFQIISEIGDCRGDYPGVCRWSQRHAWLARCPDPNLLLQINALH